MAGKFVIKPTTNSQYMFNLKATNGEIILTSETYIQKSGTVSGINSVKDCSQYDSRFVRKKSILNQDYFVLKSWNNEVIGTSEMYSSSTAMEDGIKSVKENAPNAIIEDLA